MNRVLYHINFTSLCISLVQAILCIIAFLSAYSQPDFISKMRINKLQEKNNIDIVPDILPINRSEIFYVYHSGGMYIDPVDPKGERCLIPWDYTDDIQKAKLIMYNTLDNYYMLTRPRDPSLRPDQATCIESMESATNYDAIITNRYSFNYTMFYSLTSDVPIPYAEYFESSEKPLEINEKRGHLVCAFISNCGAANGRTEYVEELMQYIKIDSYGGCLNNAQVPAEWEKHERDRTKEAVVSHYKFTLAFENSDDDDYITEKLYQPLRYGSVPIFRGCKNVEDFVPPHSVIDANKFNSAKELAKYLNYLDKHDDEYNKYLEWKKNNDLGNLAKVRFFRDRYEYGVCALVERMHGLWINPFLTDWKRVTNSTLGCNKCTEGFNLSKRRIPKLRADGWTYEYPVNEYWSKILYGQDSKAKDDTSNNNNNTTTQENDYQPLSDLTPVLKPTFVQYIEKLLSIIQPL